MPDNENMQNQPLANNHISVDCVVVGFDGDKLKVLLIRRMGEEGGEVFHDMKLPGSLIYMDEDLDEAAARDMANVAVGIVWQTALVAAPIYLVLKQWGPAAIAALLVAVASVVLKRNWYDKLED